ncbi:hypothetical protein D9M68_789020 [compost metagenome]
MDIALIGQAGCAQADADARLVHHLEHIGQALVCLAHQIADRSLPFAETEHGGGGVAVAQFVQQASESHIIACAEPSFVVHQNLGHQEQ